MLPHTPMLSTRKHSISHQQPEVNYLLRFSPPLRGDRSRKIGLFENLDIVHIRLLVECRGLYLLLFFFTLRTGPRRSLSLKLRDAKVYAHQRMDSATHADAIHAKALNQYRGLYIRRAHVYTSG